MHLRTKIKKSILFALGVVFVITGVIGVVVPLLPSTPFFLLSAWLFMRSSKTAHDWLYRQPYIGEALKKWDKSKAIAPKNKIIAIAMISISIAIILVKAIPMMVAIPVITSMLAIIGFIYTRPSN